ncbi:MAG: hypothetical protein MUO39_06155 [Steroidobacteraceae bacterium]|nr:hypothetical protein [Steroidobacteraceae bacterium]
MHRLFEGMILGACVMLAGLPTTATAGGDVACQLSFQLSGWSVFYKESSGSGTIKCSNGQSMAVKLEAKGGGLTFGKSTIDDGRGEFSGVSDISELIGSYASAEAHAGAVKSAKAQVVTKGEVSLALSGTGRGWDVGVAFGNFIISRQ